MLSALQIIALGNAHVNLLNVGDDFSTLLLKATAFNPVGGDRIISDNPENLSNQFNPGPGSPR